MTNAMLRQALAPLGVIVALLSGFAAAPSAQAAPDTTGPTLTVSPVSSYLVGQETSDTISEEYPDQNGLWFEEGGAYRVFRWSATDPSGICRYTVAEEYNAEGWTGETNVTSTHSTSGKYTYYANEFSHSDSLTAIEVNAYDCAGNVTSVFRSISQAHVERDFGPTVPSGWARTSCLCAIGDSMVRTSTKNASLRTVVNGRGTNVHVALVMAKGPTRGKAAIYFDGAYQTTVDTYAATNTNRVVMWDKGLAGSVNHTIKVVNLATVGRPRIDRDAYLR
jgi:hypothetical protein